MLPVYLFDNGNTTVAGWGVETRSVDCDIPLLKAP
jgi:hypothetical protein